MSKAKQARAKPGLKMLTPWEKQLVARMDAEMRRRWEALLAVNKWRAIK